MITFNHPWALLLALPAAWLLWRSRRPAVQTHTVANLFLWLEAETTASARRNERRAAPPWLVWLQAGVLAALAIAVASPRLPSLRPAGALIVDVSMSMSARVGSQTRLELAKAAAKHWLASQSSDLIRIIAAGADATEIATARANSPAASAAVDSLQTTTAPGEIASAIDRARSVTTGDIAVVTDLASPELVGDMRLAWRQVGMPVNNVAITGLDATVGGGAILEVTNFGSARTSLSLDVTGESSPWRAEFEIAPSEVRAFPFAAGPDRTLAAALTVIDSTNDAIAGDNRRAVAIRRARRLTVRQFGVQAAVAAALGAIGDISVIGPGGIPSSRPADVVVCAAQCAVAETSPSLRFVPGGSDPTITRRDAGSVRHIVASVDIDHSPWLMTPAFPMFVADSLDWLSRTTRPTLTATRVAAIAESDARSVTSPRLADSAPAAPADSARSGVFAFAVLAVAGVLIELVLRWRAPRLRLAATALIAAALAGVTLPFGASGRSAVIALDVSTSVSGHQRAINERSRRETAQATSGDHATVLRFGGAETDIAAVIRAARAALPSRGDRRVLVATDGQETVGDAVAAARAAGLAGLQIDVVPIDSRTPAYIERVDAPRSARTGAIISIRIAVKGRANEVLAMSVSRDGHEIDARRVVLNDTGDGEVVVSDMPSVAGLVFYHAALADPAMGITLSESGAAVSLEGRGRVLLVSEHRGVFRQLAGTRSFDLVDSTPERAPDTRAALAEFSAMVLDAVPPHRLSTRQLDAIESAVSIDGMGLFVLGSRNSLDASEFAGGAFADALPIDFTTLPTPPSKSGSLALLVDISGSMAATSDGVTKIAAARDAIARALSVLSKSDAVEVIGFAAQPIVVVAPGDARDATALARKLNALNPSGRTSLAPAVRDAVAWLNSTPNERRRVLLVTDGKTSVSDAEATRAAVRGQQIEVSVVTIGNDAEREWLSELAASTGGRAFFPDHLGDLAREVAREAARGASGREVNERFVVRAGAHPLAPDDPAPTLDGYVAGRLRDGAVAAWKSSTDAAVLAAWPHGLGRVAVFSSSLDDGWGAPMRSWSRNGSFWPSAIQWIARDGEPSVLDAELTLSTEGPRIAVDLGGTAVRSGGLPAVQAVVIDPSGRAITTRLHAVSETRFEGALPLAAAGEYRASISVSNNGVAEARSSRGWYWTGSLESQSRGSNLALLEEIARVSGGRMLAPLDAPASVADSVFGAARTRTPVDGVPWFLMAAVMLLSFDYIRRTAEAGDHT